MKSSTSMFKVLMTILFLVGLTLPGHTQGKDQAMTAGADAVEQVDAEELKAEIGSALGELSQRVNALESGIGKVKTNFLIQGWVVTDMVPGSNPEMKLGNPSVQNVFRLRRVEIKFSGPAAQNVSWFVMIDPSRAIGDSEAATSSTVLGQPLSRPVSVTAKTADNAQTKRILQDVGISWAVTREDTFHFYQGKIPFGKEGTDSSSALLFVERSPMSTILKWTDARDLGVKIVDARKMMDFDLTTELGMFQGEGQNATDTNYVKDPSVRLFIKTPWGPLVGADWYDGRLGAGADNTGSSSSFNFRKNFVLNYVLGPLYFQTEYASGNVQGVGKQTAYGDIGYMVLDRLQLAARYQWVITNDSTWDNAALQQHEVVFGANVFFDPEKPHLTKLQVNLVASSNPNQTYSTKTGTGNIASTNPFAVNNDLQVRTNWQAAF